MIVEKWWQFRLRTEIGSIPCELSIINSNDNTFKLKLGNFFSLKWNAFMWVVVIVTMLCPNLLWSHGLQPTRFLCPWNFPGKNTGVGHHFLLQGIFPTQGSNPGLLHWQVDSLLTKLWGKPIAMREKLWGKPMIHKGVQFSSVQFSCSVVSDSFATSWTVALQTLLSMRFPRQEYWSGSPFPSPGDLPDPEVAPVFLAWQADSLSAEPQGKPKNTGVGSLSLLQGIFLTQRLHLCFLLGRQILYLPDKLNWGLLHCRWILY